LSEEVAYQAAMAFFFDAGEELCSQLPDCLGAIEGQTFVHLSAVEVTGHTLGLKDGFNLRVEVYFLLGRLGSRYG
jgi:hypothetical protein